MRIEKEIKELNQVVHDQIDRWVNEDDFKDGKTGYS